MSLSNSTKTLLIDPRSHNNTRTEFRLDDNFYASSLKLVDVGLSDPNATGEEFLYPTFDFNIACLAIILTSFAAGSETKLFI